MIVLDIVIGIIAVFLALGFLFVDINKNKRKEFKCMSKKTIAKELIGETKKEYDPIRVLKGVLPDEISSSEGAFTEFIKFVDKGWFDPATAMYVLADGRNKKFIGRAIYWICRRNGIPSPERVFAPLWRMKPETVKEWLRENNTKRIDQIIDSILKE